MTVNIGDLLSQVEDGWKRIDDNNENIIYTGSRWKTTSEVTNSNNNSQHYTGVWGSSNVGEKGEKISFYFYGSKMILYSFMYSTSISNDISVIIDEKVQKTTQEKSNTSSYLSRAFYKIENLSKRYHKIEIVNNTNMQMFFDCIDIDSTGNIISQEEYNQGSYIKQDNKYYGFSDDNYDTTTKMYKEVTLENIKNLEYINLISNLTKETTIGDETFKPIDKFTNFQLISSYNNEPKTVIGSKSKSGLIVANGDIYAGRISDRINSFTLEYTVNNNSAIKMAVSFDNGSTWKTYKDGAFQELSITIPNKYYANMTDEEKTNYSNAKTTILENGFNASDLSSIDFNIDNLDTIRFAYVLYQDTINDDCKMSDLSWNFNAKGYLQKMKDSEVDTSFCNGIIKITPLIDCEMIITNYNY